MSYAEKSGDHVVIHTGPDKPGLIECLRCKATLKASLPISVTLLTKLTSVFLAHHSKCKSEDEP